MYLSMSESATHSRSEYANKLAGMCEMLIKLLEEVDNKKEERCKVSDVLFLICGKFSTS